ncbi:MAG: MATE family efflux transporter [Oscillospiraceae bacterium]|nr:MATE family efflux transporter [Oscillospiraceae bacterium]
MDATDTESKQIFPRPAVIKLVLPLIVEQFLAISIGLADSVMVASVGEDAMSAISVVDSINILLINIFAALATGGAIIASQYLGRNDEASARKAAKQLISATFLLSIVIAVLSLCLNEWLLRSIFGRTEESVMRYCVKYFFWSALSYPFIAVYNGGAAILRSMGNSKSTMFVSVAVNIINVCGNALLIYGFSMGVSGAAIASLAARAVGAAAVLLILRDPHKPIYIDSLNGFIPEFCMTKRILSLGIPTGLENGMFQVGKILVQRLVTLGGTSAIAANAATGSLANMLLIPASAIGLALITINGQCVGAGEYRQAKNHTKKLMICSYISIAALAFICIIFMGPLLTLYNLKPDTTILTKQLLTTYCIASSLMWPMAFVLPNTLRAAGDVKFTMRVSVFSMWIFRIGFAYLFVYIFNLGTLSVWLAMYCDWVVRSSFFLPRILGTKWMSHRVIEEQKDDKEQHETDIIKTAIK